MLAAVGSDNPVKVNAVKRAFGAFFGEIPEVKAVKVSSGTSPEPFYSEVLRGAKNRAERAMEIVARADFGVGIEGGVVRVAGVHYLGGLVYVVARDGTVGRGFSGLFECPPEILERLIRGEELGDVIAQLTGEPEAKRGKGAIGFLTGGAVDRTGLYEHGVLMALASMYGWPRLARGTPGDTRRTGSSIRRRME